MCFHGTPVDANDAGSDGNDDEETRASDLALIKDGFFLKLGG